MAVIRRRRRIPRSNTALLVLDLITDLAFPDGELLQAPALRAARRASALAVRARRARCPVIYANDDLGQWRSDAPGLIDWCARESSRGRAIVDAIRPDPRDFVLLKPKHSAFFGTALDVLLDQIGARRLVLAGVSAHQCVLFTATDAHVRQYELVIPRDCVAAPRRSETSFALRYAEDVLDADTRASPSIRVRRGTQ